MFKVQFKKDRRTGGLAIQRPGSTIRWNRQSDYVGPTRKKEPFKEKGANKVKNKVKMRTNGPMLYFYFISNVCPKSNPRSKLFLCFNSLERTS